MNHDGKNDIVNASYTYPDTANVFTVAYGTGGGVFSAPQVITNQTNADCTAVADYNGDGFNDIAFLSPTRPTVDVWQGTSGGTFSPMSIIASAHGSWEAAAGDINADGVADILGVEPSSSTQAFISVTRSTYDTPTLDLLTQSGARAAMKTLQATFDRLSNESAAIGAAQSRLSVAAANLQAQILGCREAESRIADADVAQEAAVLLKNQVLQRAGAAVLAQANQRSSIVLGLLRG